MGRRTPFDDRLQDSIKLLAEGRVPPQLVAHPLLHHDAGPLSERLASARLASALGLHVRPVSIQRLTELVDTPARGGRGLHDANLPTRKARTAQRRDTFQIGRKRIRAGTVRL